MKEVSIMNYPKFDDFDLLNLNLCNYAKLKCEQGTLQSVMQIINDVRKYMEDAVQQIKNLPDEQSLKQKEPDDYESILLLREQGKRKLWQQLPDDAILQDKMNGALLGRMIGCILGSPVELMSVENMQGWSDTIGQSFPPTDYWENVEKPYIKNFYGSYRSAYIKHNMKSVPVDDDIVYTQLALLIAEEYGLDFTTEDVGAAWLKYVPFACTAEEVALNNLKAGVAAARAAEQDNPYAQWIGAAIRSDGFAYAAAGYPEKAAGMAYRDAYLTHRRNGIYGEMFLAAAQSAAFAVEDPLEAIQIALTEIPKECHLHEDIEWALAVGNTVTNYRDARKMVDERFRGMDVVHTNNNLCLIVFGLIIAQGDIVKGLSELVAMGLDNDCTAASAGSILGAVAGKSKIPAYLYNRFNNTAETYLKGIEVFKIDDMVNRFIKLAKQTYQG
jgi:ADP-ribosylglycohydrolase